MSRLLALTKLAMRLKQQEEICTHRRNETSQETRNNKARIEALEAQVDELENELKALRSLLPDQEAP